MSLIKNLKVKKDGFEIDIQELEILDQGVHIIWGPSGGGKTTFLKALLGIEKSIGFSWIFNDTDLAKLSIADRRLGVVFQTLDLFPHMTAYENIVFAAQARGIPKIEYTVKIHDWSAKLNMEYFLNRKAEYISGGEAQRVALVRALIGQPRMLLLDEPLSHLDKALRQEARLILKNVISEIKIPVLMITHDEQDITDLAQKVSRFQNGKVT